jgi:ankyrin repeat protein
MALIQNITLSTSILIDPSQPLEISGKPEPEVIPRVQTVLSKRVNIDTINSSERGVGFLKKTAKNNKEFAQQIRKAAFEDNPLELEDLLKSAELQILKAILNTRDEDGDTPLLLCALSGSKKCMHLLLNAGADPFVSNDRGNNFLHLAAKKGNSGILEIFLERVSKDRELSITAYQKLINAVNEEGCTPFLLCPYSNNIASMLLLLDLGVEPQQKNRKTGRNLVHLATICGHSEMLRVFFKRMATDPKIPKDLCHQMVNEMESASELTPLFLSATSNSIPCMNLLLEQGADPFFLSPSSKMTFIQFAAEEGLIDMLREYSNTLSRRGKEMMGRCKAMVNISNSKGRTPLLSCAFAKKGIDTMNFLLDLGANPFHADTLANNFIHHAVLEGQVDLLTAFIQRLSSSCIDKYRCKNLINARNDKGMTPVFLCSTTNGPGCLNVLLENGATLFVIDRRGGNPYLNALEHGEDLSARSILEKEPRFAGMAAATVMGHVFGFDVPRTRLPGILGKSISLQGSSGIFMHKLILTDLEQPFTRETFFANVTDSKYAQLLVAFTRSCMKNPPAEELAEIIRKGELAIVLTGWKGHGITLVFRNGYMIICNRGDGCLDGRGSSRTFVARKIALDQVTPDLMETIFDTDSRSKEEGIQFFYETLSGKLQGKRDPFCRSIEGIKPKYSKAEVCAYSSAKAALRASLALLAGKLADLEESAKQPSKQWSTHHRKWARAYFKSAPSPFTNEFNQMMEHTAYVKLYKRGESGKKTDPVSIEEEEMIKTLVASKL